MTTGTKNPPRTLLGVRGLSKHFGGTKALDAVDFDLRPGEVHALLGENGAGKSTLIKVLSGLYRPDAGEIDWPPAGPEGLAFVHQDLGLVDTASVAENFGLGAGFRHRGPFIDWTATERAVAEALGRLDVHLEPRRLVGHLSPAEKAMLAITRALARNADVLILDEPTATLPNSDVRRLHDAVRALAARGIGIIYVTHRLGEVFEIADRVTVLRDGRRVFTGEASECDDRSLVDHIVGRKVGSLYPDRKGVRGRTVLEVDGLVSKSVGPVSFDLAEGEILGLVGLRNAGQDTCGRLVAGVLRPRGGAVRLGGRAVPPGRVDAAIGRGIGFVSSKRLEESLFVGMSLSENLFPDPRHNGLDRINTGAERDRAQSVLDRYGVRPPRPKALVSSLSGGNQQKVVLARWSDRQVRVLVLEEPTIGVDVGARADAYAILSEAVSLGQGVIVVSSDFEEVAGLCDRALVFREGRIAAELEGGDITPSRLLETAGGRAA
jgi:ribose transport system ATP-binding protein